MTTDSETDNGRTRVYSIPEMPSMRDAFAGHALQGMVYEDDRAESICGDGTKTLAALYARRAYLFADAMMECRQAQQNILNREIFLREQAEKRAQMAEYAVKNLTAANEDYKRIVAELRAHVAQAIERREN